MTSLRKFGVAILGIGRIGSAHIKSLQLSGRANVKWFLVQDVPKAERLAQRFESPPQCLHHSQMDQMLEDESVDSVFICSPTTHHESQIKAALNQGKAVFCEKPVTDNIESTRSCYELARAKGLPLFCAFHRRFDASFTAVREAIHSNKHGRLRLLRVSSHDPSPPPLEYIKSSGGILSDSTIHDLDMALWMTGSPAKSVYVQGQAFDPDIQEAGDSDLVVVIVTHQNGAVTIIDNGRRCSHGYDQRLEAQCDDGSFVVSNWPLHQMTQYGADISKTPPIDQSFSTRYPDAYALEVEHFLDVLEGAPLKVTKDDTLSAMSLVHAAMRSKETRLKVDLS